MALTILLQLNRDDARLFFTERFGEHQLFSLICMHCNKKVGAMSHRLKPLSLQKNHAGAPAYFTVTATAPTRECLPSETWLAMPILDYRVSH